MEPKTVCPPPYTVSKRRRRASPPILKMWVPLFHIRLSEAWNVFSMFRFGPPEPSGVNELLPLVIRSGLVVVTNQLFATFNVPDAVQGVSMYLPNGGPDGWFNPAAFSQPGQMINTKGTPLTKFGTLARRAGRGPSTRDLDFSVFRSFALRERVNLQFRAEAFNLTNTPAFFLPSAASPALTIGNASFGRLSSSSATGRQLQFGLKLVF